MTYKEIYEYWKSSKYFDDKTKMELDAIKDDENEIEDRFYRNLEFGTAGLRGKLGAGTNRMNLYIVSKTTQGLADLIKSQSKDSVTRGVAIAYDNRHFSKEFAMQASLILASNNIKVYLFESLRPTPVLSYTVRKLNTISGIVITASHNPKEYNGYKVYWEDGAQILQKHADAITENIDKIKNFEDIKIMNEKDALDKGLLNIIGSEIDDSYVKEVKGLSLRDDIYKDIKIVYTPLNGTGNILVRRVLKERGFKNVTVVPEQENPDPNFTTTPFPNPEDIGAFSYAIELGKNIDADLLIATDPDCDRLAIMVKDKKGDYTSFNGNQTGAILTKYIIESRKELGILPPNAAIVKSIVTGDFAKSIAAKYGVKTFETLTGFKNICGKIEDFEKNNDYEFIFGYEESIGYVTGTFVRDKDAIISSMMLCEAAAYYKKSGKSLIDILEESYEEFGYFKENLISLVLEGIEGSKRILRMMEVYRKDYPTKIGDAKLLRYIDYKIGKEINLETSIISNTDVPSSNVLKFIFDDDSWYAVRPSGTEPKIKLYMYSKESTSKKASEKLVVMKDLVFTRLQSVK